MVGDRSVIGAKSAVLQDVPPDSFVLGHPATDHRAWKRSQAALRRLPDLMHAVARMERAAARGAGEVPPAKMVRPRGARRSARRVRERGRTGS